MERVDIPLYQDIELAWDGEAHCAHVLHVSEGTLLLRLPPESVDWALPATVTLAYGHQEYLWRVPASVCEAWGPWWIVERPEAHTEYRQQRRAYVRINLETSMLAIPVTPTGQQAGNPVSVSIHNLSAGGCLAQAEQGLGHEGDLVLILLALPNLPTIPVISELVRVPDPAGVGGYYGIQFKSLQMEHQEQLAAFISQFRPIG